MITDRQGTIHLLHNQHLAFFSSRSLKTREKYILVLSVCIFFEGSTLTFQFLNDKIHNYVLYLRKKGKKKPNISHLSMYCECRVGNNLQHLLTMYFFRESQMVTQLKNQLEKCHRISLKEIDVKDAMPLDSYFLGRYVHY